MRTFAPKLAPTLIAMVVCVTPKAFALQTGFYVDVRLGQSKFDSDTSSTVDAIPIQETTRTWTDDSGQMWSIGIGYQLHRFVAIEADYYDFGKATFSERRVTSYRLTPTVTDDLSGEAEADGFALGVVGSLPFDNWNFYAEVKALFSTVVLSGPVARSSVGPISTTPVLSTSSFYESTNSTGVLYGVGIEYVFRGHYGVEMMWQQVTNLGNQNHLGGIDLQSLSAGFKYRF
jgi:hypothetical protein